MPYSHCCSEPFTNAIQLMLKLLFKRDSKVEDMFCGAPPSSESSLFFSNNLFSFGFKPIQDDSQLTDEADNIEVVAQL